MFQTAERTADGVRLIDQRKLPTVETYLELKSLDEVIEAIKEMVVRGAPAIGITAAFGLAMTAQQAAADEPSFDQTFAEACDRMEQARPTAVNLAWAVRRLRTLVTSMRADGKSIPDVLAALEKDAQAIHDEDL